jgi:hypothetical protein
VAGVAHPATSRRIDIAVLAAAHMNLTLRR